jgi:hypothetical protein
MCSIVSTGTWYGSGTWETDIPTEDVLDRFDGHAVRVGNLGDRHSVFSRKDEGFRDIRSLAGIGVSCPHTGGIEETAARAAKAGVRAGQPGIRGAAGAPETAAPGTGRGRG